MPENQKEEAQQQEGDVISADDVIKNDGMG